MHKLDVGSERCVCVITDIKYTQLMANSSICFVAMYIQRDLHTNMVQL